MRILVASRQCEHSKALVAECRRRGIDDTFQLALVEDLRSQGIPLPEGVTHVPCILDTDTGATVLGRKAFDYLLRKGPSTGGAQGPPLPESPPDNRRVPSEPSPMNDMGYMPAQGAGGDELDVYASPGAGLLPLGAEIHAPPDRHVPEVTTRNEQALPSVEELMRARELDMDSA